jgi:hypothetical protein
MAVERRKIREGSNEMATTMYHVAGDKYESGDDLRCWDYLYEQGIVTEDDWQWDAEMGLDSDVVCMYRTREEAEEHISIFGGATLLRISLPDDVHTTTVAEGFPAIFGRIPAEWIEVA